MAWTDERIERLKKLWADGLSCSQIASELGGITRNAVISKVHRLGLSGRAKRTAAATSRPRRAPQAPRLRLVPKGVPQLNGNGLEYDPGALSAPELIEIPVEQRKTLLQLNEHTCRWPIGDPTLENFYFCGAEPIDTYCAYHTRIAYQPSEHRHAKRALRG